MKKILLSLLVIITLAGVAFLLWPVLQPKPKKEGLPGPITSKAAKDIGQVGPTEVTIKGNAFLPPQIVVKKGTKVTWTNQDTAKHSVTTDAGSPGGPNGPALTKGQTYQFTFDTIGTYNYHAGDQPSMRGSVAVTE